MSRAGVVALHVCLLAAACGLLACKQEDPTYITFKYHVMPGRQDPPPVVPGSESPDVLRTSEALYEAGGALGHRQLAPTIGTGIMQFVEEFDLDTHPYGLSDFLQTYDEETGNPVIPDYCYMAMVLKLKQNDEYLAIGMTYFYEAHGPGSDDMMPSAVAASNIDLAIADWRLDHPSDRIATHEEILDHACNHELGHQFDTPYPSQHCYNSCIMNNPLDLSENWIMFNKNYCTNCKAVLKAGKP